MSAADKAERADLLHMANRFSPRLSPMPDGGMLPPQPGHCHAWGCDEKSTHVARVRRIGRGGWTTGIDYCEPHAHEAANRMRKRFSAVLVEVIR